MRFIQVFALLGIAGTAIAAPRGRGGNGRGGNVVVEHSVVYVDQNGNRLPNHRPKYQPNPSVVYVDQDGNRLPGPGAYKPKPQTPPPEAANPKPDTPGNNNGNAGSAYIDIVNSWRAKLANPKPPMTTDPGLESGAYRTASEWAAKQHQLLNGARAQVMAPGSPGNFESVFVGGWLCEIPGLFAGNVCASWVGGWDHSSGERRHAEYVSGDHTKIGCAFAAGTWICDMA